MILEWQGFMQKEKSIETLKSFKRRNMRKFKTRRTKKKDLRDFKIFEMPSQIFLKRTKRSKLSYQDLLRVKFKLDGIEPLKLS